ncbi:MAG: hypothetical protein COA42_21820 [Alteromonadaceae bacterium]|nr:MAG: hypothetical protein COA42_21820 [Alteromonadaceae bacterium]
MPESIEQQLEQLQKNYLAKLELDLQALKRYYQQLADPAVENKKTTALISLQQLVHKLSGSGGCFGFPDISTCSEPLDTYLLALINNNEQCQTEGISKLITPLFAAIQQALKK